MSRVLGSGEDRQNAQFQQIKPALSPWAEVLAADAREREKVGEANISLNSFARGMARIAREENEWAGLPVPLMGERMVIEKSYTYADIQESVNRITKPPADGVHVCSNDDVNEETALRNQWWSDRLRSDIYIWQEGKQFLWGRKAGLNHIATDLTTLGCADAWTLETEFRAMETLRTLVPHRQFRQYLLTGCFMESSQRSGVHYLFRRLRPTVAISSSTGELRILCALCLHPVAYYEGSWAGAQCPTDDVIGHLMLMRGDEHMLWKRANQHPAIRPESGL
jgi:hypothetical protein